MPKAKRKSGNKSKPKSATVGSAASRAVSAAAAPATNNAVWSDNNAACLHTWINLKRVLGQFDEDFPAAENLTMSNLAFWNSLAGGESRNIEAMAIADILTKIFVELVGAEYERDQNYASAVSAMTTILTDPDKTVSQLAAVVDETHKFPVGETRV